MSISLSYAASKLPETSALSALDESNFDGIREYVYRLAFSLTLDRCQAEDVTQEALVRIWDHRASLCKLQAPKAWIARVVVNASRSHWRTRPKWLRFGQGVEPTGGEIDPNLIALRAAIAGLDESKRHVVLLVGVFGASYEEAAVALDLAEGTVASRFHHAKLALKSALGDGE